MGFFSFINQKRKKISLNKPTQSEIDVLLSNAFTFSRESNYIEAHKIYKYLYELDQSKANEFNLLQTSVHCSEKDLEVKLYSILKNNKSKDSEPKELNGPFVRFYYATCLCEQNRNSEAIEIVDYLLKLISQNEVTSSNYLYSRGLPHVGMMKDLIKKVFINDEKMHEVYKHKLLDVVDIESKKALKERYNY